jgi:hypothetical protein
LVIWKQPSPSIAQTSASGRPTFAPIAAGTSNDDIKVARDTAPDFDYEMGEVVSEEGGAK